MVAGQDEQCAVELAAVAALMQGEGVAVKGGLNDHLRDSADYTDFQAEWRAVEKAVDAGFGAAACTRWGHLFPRDAGGMDGIPAASVRRQPGKSPGNAGTGFYGGAPCRSPCND